MNGIYLYPLITYNKLLNMAIEIVDLAIKMVIFIDFP